MPRFVLIPLNGLALLAAGGPAHAEYTLVGPLGYTWEIDDSGRGTPGIGDSGTGAIVDGTSDATDRWPFLCVRTCAACPAECEIDEVYYAGDVPSVVDLGRRRVILAEATVSGLTVHREVFVPDDGWIDFARFVDVLENPGAAPVTVTVRFGSARAGDGLNDLGSDEDTVVAASSDGDLEAERWDEWFVTESSNPASLSPAVVHVMQGAPRLTNVSFVGFDNLGDDDPSDLAWEYEDVVVPAGGRVVFVTFIVQAPDTDSAQWAGRLLADTEDWPRQAGEGLSDELLADAINAGGAPIVVLDDPLEFGLRSDGALVTADESVGLRRTGDDDYLTPGRPFEAWSVTYDGLGVVTNGETLSEIPMGPRSVDLDGPAYAMTFEGQAGDLGVEQLVTYTSGDDVIDVQITLTNVGAGSLADVAYLRTVDPDQDALNAFPVGRHQTWNDVVDVEGGVLVVGEGDAATIGMVSLAPAAVASVENFATDPAAVIASPADPDGAWSDGTLAIGYALGDLAPGASVTFDVHYVVGETLDDVLVAAADLGVRVPDVTDADGDGSTWPDDCDDSDASAYPGAPELCNGLDDDCDDTDADDGSDESWFDEPCDGSDADLCLEGAWLCLGGAQTCSDDSTDDRDVCDGEDNDCDPSTADGSAEAWYGEACDGDDADLCEEGALTCDGTGQVCDDETGDAVEVCNDEDDDCDGEADEGLSCGPDADADADSDVDVDADADSDGDVDADADADGDGDGDADAGPNPPGLAGGGWGCSATGGTVTTRGAWGWATLLLAAFVGVTSLRRRARRTGAARGSALLVTLLALTAPLAAEAQVTPGTTLDQYRAAETPEDYFAISQPNDLGHLRFGAQLHLDYAYDPLVWERVQGERDTQTAALVEHQLVGNVGLSLGVIRRLVFFAGLPVNLLMTGMDVAGMPSADGTALGDFYLGFRVRIWGDDSDIFAIAFQGTVTAPTAEATHEGQAYAGERNFTGHPEIVAEVRPGPVRIALNVGARFREGADFDTFQTSHELTYGLGLAWLAHEMVSVHAEAYGSSSFADFADRESSPLELIAGLRAHPGMGFHVGLAGGLGLTRGAGSPAARAVLTFGWAMPEREAGPAPEPEVGDRDQDGILDDADQCPGEAEDADQFEDEDGCPDPDNDQDGVLDADDQCPNEPEDIDQFEDENGCPDPDNDQDGVLDGDDQCPNEPEDRDGFDDENGCPDPDNDQDSVLDGDDQCPNAPGRPADNGCPRTVRLEEGRIQILQRIEFATDSDRLLPRSEEILEEIRAVLAANPQIRRVRVEGHTDDRGRDAHNMDLSQRRAASVVRWLTTHGIAEARLQPQGFGETRPLVANDTAAHRQTNRRVEFIILDPAPRAE